MSALHIVVLAYLVASKAASQATSAADKPDNIIVMMTGTPWPIYMLDLTAI